MEREFDGENQPCVDIDERWLADRKRLKRPSA